MENVLQKMLVKQTNTFIFSFMKHQRMRLQKITKKTKKKQKIAFFSSFESELTPQKRIDFLVFFYLVLRMTIFVFFLRYAKIHATDREQKISLFLEELIRLRNVFFTHIQALKFAKNLLTLWQFYP